MSDANGQYKFLVLPPGDYKATYSLSGYQTREQENIAVRINSTTKVDVIMTSAFTDEVVVTSETPLVDTANTTLGVALTQEFYADLPVQRNYASVARVTPGAQVDDSGQTFYGSTGAENAYYIEATRQLAFEEGQHSVCFVALTYVMEPQILGEQKSKAAQLGIRRLLECGVQPHIIACRAQTRSVHPPYGDRFARRPCAFAPRRIPLESKRAVEDRARRNDRSTALGERVEVVPGPSNCGAVCGSSAIAILTLTPAPASGASFSLSGRGSSSPMSRSVPPSAHH